MHGYSSSDESDDPRRPRSQPSSSSNNQDNKKKRKKRLPPQQSINKIWKKFSNRKFYTALSILPFDSVAPRSGLDRPNELLSEGYERAAEECRRKVEKIVKECKRVNMRYRDQGWDLDWDLRYEKGNTLNYIGSDKFEINKTTLLGSKAVVPKAVKRVHEIFEKPTFLKDVSGSDVKQGGLGDCWLMSSFTALASADNGVPRCCVAYDTKIGIYGFLFYRDGEWVYSIVDDKLYLKSPGWDSPSMQRDLLQQIDRNEETESTYRKTYQTGSKALFFAQCKDQNETWVPLLEKAYAKAHGDYASLSGGWIGEGLEDLSGGVTTELLASDILDLDAFWDNELSKVNKEFMFGCSAGILDYGYGHRDGISEAHAYVVTDARTLKSGQRLVKLRNPWGEIRKGLWEGAWSDGSKEWTAEAQEELGHKFGSDSVFWITFEDLVRKYTHFDRTRLFREDDDWRCCQRWIGVDVPWKAEYHEKFRIKLTKDSPLILVLSQLDGRYFKGLQGQYSFRLHFRLHHEDQPDAEDYIVRSHGNYFMKRSVSVELPDLPSGNYTVYLKVTGQRNQELPSVEEVVKRESQKRVENEKLAQVGYAYDLAHSKAWEHMEKVTEIRNKRDQEKATTHRQKERRRQWERRHISRDVTKKQKKKNGEKKERKKELREELRKKAIEAAAKAEVKEETNKSENVSGVSTPLDGDIVNIDVSKLALNDDSDSSASGSPTDTPKSEKSSIFPSDEKEDVPPVSGAPPAAGEGKDAAAEEPKPAEEEEKKPEPPAVVEESDGDSSDSPVEDWEELYSDDDYTRRPRQFPYPAPPLRDDYDTEEEKMPTPWNAVCIVGIRVYSKDEELELLTVMEGGSLDGMGEKGQADLDNAQDNAGGVRLGEENGAGEIGLGVDME